jgi:hypothetical protein
MDNATLADEVAGRIADQLGDSWFHYPDELPDLRDSRQTGDSEATFYLADGREVIVTVSVSR